MTEKYKVQLKQDISNWIIEHFHKPLFKGKFESQRSFELRVRNKNIESITCHCVGELIEQEKSASKHLLTLAEERNDLEYAIYIQDHLSLYKKYDLCDKDKVAQRNIKLFDKFCKIVRDFTAQSLTDTMEKNPLQYSITSGKLSFPFINEHNVSGIFKLMGTRINKTEIHITYFHPVLGIKLICEYPIFMSDIKLLISCFKDIVNRHDSGYKRNDQEEHDHQLRFLNRLNNLKS